MARKRIELPTAVEAEIAARTARGETAETIFQAIGKAISVPTIRRRQVELRSGTANAGKQSKAPAPSAGLGIPAQGTAPDTADDLPEDLPETTPLEDLDRWINRLEHGARKAEAASNLSALASIAAKVTMLMALRHKSTPVPKADPNESPDMKALAAQGRERLSKLANGLFAPQ